MTESERNLFSELLFAEDNEPRTATKRAILFALQSPHFLYADLGSSEALTETGAKKADQNEIATRLAFALWDSIPDERLAKDATEGKLTNDAIARHAKRMLDDSRAHAKMHGFFHHWLELDERDRSKDQDEYPEFNQALRADLRRSLEIFLDEIIWSDESDYRQLLLADHLHLNEPLRKLYASGEKGDGKEDGFTRLSFEDRSGVLTHPYLLSALAYACLLYTSPSPRDATLSRMPSSA